MELVNNEKEKTKGNYCVCGLTSICQAPMR